MFHRFKSFLNNITAHSCVIDMVSTAQNSSSDKFVCTNCTGPNPKSFNSVRGLWIHNTRCHPNAPPLRINTEDKLSLAAIVKQNLTSMDIPSDKLSKTKS